MRMYESKIDGIQGLINSAETEFEALIAERSALKDTETELSEQIEAKRQEREQADRDAQDAIDAYEREKLNHPDDPPPQ